MRKAMIDTEKKISTDEQKRLLLDMMAFVHDFCKEHAITYYLAYGSLLGAVRHHGFIPWDDDMDIQMKRKDYMRFISIFNEASDRYKVVSMYDTKGYYLPFAKIIDTETVLRENIYGAIDLGLGIDIFPLDNAGNDLKYAKKKAKRVVFWHKMSRKRNAKARPDHNLLKKTVISIGNHLISNRLCLHKIDHLVRLDENAQNMKYLSYDFIEFVESLWYSDRQILEFEGYFFWGPCNYDAVLRNAYGDYMTPPPLEEQVTHHDFSVRWK